MTRTSHFFRLYVGRDERVHANSWPEGLSGLQRVNAGEWKSDGRPASDIGLMFRIGRRVGGDDSPVMDATDSYVSINSESFEGQVNATVIYTSAPVATAPSAQPAAAALSSGCSADSSDRERVELISVGTNKASRLYIFKLV
jgi:hypothetical protein